jgi:hypothetical protein
MWSWSSRRAGSQLDLWAMFYLLMVRGIVAAAGTFTVKVPVFAVEVRTFAA